MLRRRWSIRKKEDEALAKQKKEEEALAKQKKEEEALASIQKVVNYRIRHCVLRRWLRELRRGRVHGNGGARTSSWRLDSRGKGSGQVSRIDVASLTARGWQLTKGYGLRVDDALQSMGELARALAACGVQVDANSAQDACRQFRPTRLHIAAR